MLASLIYVIHNIINLGLMWFTANRCLTPRFHRSATFALEAVGLALCFLIGHIASCVPALASYRPYGIMAVFYSFTLFLYQNKLFRKFLVMSCIYISAIATEVIIYVIFPSASITAHFMNVSLLNIWWYLSYTICEAILFLSVYLIFRRKPMHDIDQVPARQYWFFLFFPISQFILLTSYVFSIAEEVSLRTSLLVLTGALICLAADIIWFREIRRLTDNARLKAENALLGQQIAAQREYYKALSANYVNMATLRHDIANHLFTIRALLTDGKTDEAMRYAAQLEQSTAARTILSSCKNSVVYSFLQHRASELEQAKIAFRFDVNLAPVTGVADTDLIIALGNLLDNAVEACSATEVPRLALTVKQADGFLQIETENTCTASAAPSKRRIAYLERGLGSTILRTLAEQYHGSYTCAREQTTNRSILILRSES